MEMQGGCLCGDITFTVHGESTGVTHCYCSMCRRHSGTGLQTFVSVWTDELIWTGRPKLYRSSDFATRGFCAQCGSSLLLDYDNQPGRVWLTAGAFDEPDQLVPTLHWCLSDRVPWIPYDKSLPDA